MNVGVLASGAGTNLQAILDRLHGRQGVQVVAVASDKPGAEALSGLARSFFYAGARALLVLLVAPEQEEQLASAAAFATLSIAVV